VRGTPFLKEGFVGGLNTIDSPYTLAENETRQCLNVVSTERGSIRKRYGSTLFAVSGSIPFELKSMFAATINGTPYLIVCGGGRIYSLSPTVIAQIGSGFSSDYWSMVQAPVSTAVPGQGPVYMVNGVDKPHYWTGAGEVKEWTGVSSTPKLTDGVLVEHSPILKSETAGFISTDLGLTINLTSGGYIKGNSAQIKSVINSKEVELSIEEGVEKSGTGVNFEITRAFYKEGGHVPNGQFMIFAENRVWMTGIKADPSAVWFSELVSIGEGGAQADPSQWPSTNVVRFDSSDGNAITGIGTVGPYLCLFKESKTWIIHDLNTGANRRIADTIGCVSNRSIVETTGGTFFLTADQGVYLTDGSKLHEMSYNVRPTILQINPAKRQNAAGAYFNNHYYLSYASGASAVANRTLDYDVQLKSWWVGDLTGNQWTIWEPVTGRPQLFAIPPGGTRGVVQAFVENVYTDSGANYTGENGLSAFWISPWEPFAYYVFRHRIKAPFLKKRVRQIFFDGEGQIIPVVFKNFGVGGTQTGAVVNNNPQSTLELPVDFFAGEETWGEEDAEWGAEETKGTVAIWGASAPVQSARIYAPGVARVWSVGYGNASDEPFEVFSFAYMIEFRKS
jgi:hypothetical protein